MESMTPHLSLLQPDDWHVHLRDGEALNAVVAHTAAQFARAVVMPNLKPPVTTVEQALAYRERILQVVPEGVDFEPLMTLYLTDNLAPEEIAKAQQALASHGFDPGPIDGVMGPKTRTALARYLAQQNLPPSDRLTPEIYRRLVP